MQFTKLAALFAFLGLAHLATLAQARISGISVPAEIKAGSQFNVTFHTENYSQFNQQWFTLIGAYPVIEANQVGPTGLGKIIFTDDLKKRGVDVTGYGKFDIPVFAPKVEQNSLPLEYNIAVAYLETSGRGLNPVATRKATTTKLV